MIESLPRREREVFEILCRLEVATAAGVRAAMADTLSDSAVRTLLTRLEGRGAVSRSPGADGFEYRPAPAPDTLVTGALRRMVDTFFAGSAASAATALLGLGEQLTPEDAAALKRAIDEAEARG